MSRGAPMIDWVSVIHQCRMSDQDIADRIGVAHTRVRGWRQYGYQPRYCDGEALLALWVAVTENLRESAPRK